MKVVVYCTAFSFFTLFSTLVYSQSSPSSQSAGAIQGQEEQLKKEQQLEQQIQTKKKKTEKAVTSENNALPEGGQKTLVKKIDVKGVTLIPQLVVDKITKDYEGKELTLKDMQKVCDLITDEYRKKGYVTSRAYMPPQTISVTDGILVIIVIQGKVGSIEIKGNKYFSSQVYKKRLEMKQGEYFDYQALQKALVEINDHPDRFVKVGLVPGKSPGTTDLVLEVQDRFPIHLGFENDDFGTRYMRYIRNTVTAEDNNLTGHDDKLSFQYQRSMRQYYSSPYISYTVPINNRFNTGVYWVWSNTKLGKELESFDIKGKSSIGGPFFNYTAIDTDSVNLKLTGGFDYKRIINFTSGVETTRDEDRVLKAGLDLDVTDRFGRTVLTLEEDVGVLTGGGLYVKDPLATQPGAGAQFQKISGYLYRLQPMPFSSDILWKNAFQYTNYNLLSVEQFQLGGISNLRGYAPAAYSGDSGVTSTFDWSFPVYFLPKNTIVPGTKTSFYDATRVVIFYDVGYARLHDAMGTMPHETLQDIGYGIRFNLLENFSGRIEIAYPLAPQGENDEPHLYWDFEKKF